MAADEFGSDEKPILRPGAALVRPADWIKVHKELLGRTWLPAKKSLSARILDWIVRGARRGEYDEKRDEYARIWGKERDNFLSQYRDGDEVWIFSTGRDAWASLAGASGYAIVRNGKVVAVYDELES